MEHGEACFLNFNCLNKSCEDCVLLDCRKWMWTVKIWTLLGRCVAHRAVGKRVFKSDWAIMRVIRIVEIWSAASQESPFSLGFTYRGSLVPLRTKWWWFSACASQRRGNICSGAQIAQAQGIWEGHSCQSVVLDNAEGWTSALETGLGLFSLDKRLQGDLRASSVP